MIGFFTVTELMGDDDAAGFKVQAKVKSQMNENIIGVLWLPPHLRQGQSNIDVDATVWGILDEVSGIGCAMMGIGDADFGYFYNADIEMQKTLTVKDAVSMEKTLDVSGKVTASDAIEATGDVTSSTGNIKATVGDVKTATVSLNTHTHTCAAPESPTTPPVPVPA